MLVIRHVFGTGTHCIAPSGLPLLLPLLPGLAPRRFLSRTLMKFITCTEHQSFLCDDFAAKISLYLLLRIEHSDILDPNESLSEHNTGTQIASSNPLPTKV